MVGAVAIFFVRPFEAQIGYRRGSELVRTCEVWI